MNIPELKERLLERLLRYAAFDTRSDPESETYPSTARQLLLLNHLVEELTLIGLDDVEIDEYGYVTATVPSTLPEEDSLSPTVGFIAHVDTSPDMCAIMTEVPFRWATAVLCSRRKISRNLRCCADTPW